MVWRYTLELNVSHGGTQAVLREAWGVRGGTAFRFNDKGGLADF